MDTLIGNFNLTANQKDNLLLTDVSPFKGVTIFLTGDVYAVSESTPSQQDIDGLITKINALSDTPSQAVLVQKFNPELAIAREAIVFNASELARLMPVSYTINELIRFKNFWGGVINGTPYAGLKQIGQALVLNGTILQSDYDKLNGILQEQGIDLNS